MHRQKVAEVEKLTQTVRELEEAVLAGGAAANAVRDYQRKVQEMNVIRPNIFFGNALCLSDHDYPDFGRRKEKLLTESWLVQR